MAYVRKERSATAVPLRFVRLHEWQIIKLNKFLINILIDFKWKGNEKREKHQPGEIT